MVSFSCEVCNDTVKKAKLDQHTRQCYGAYFTCIDCSTTFQGTDYRTHTSCISEAEKYEKGLYKGKKQQKQQKQQQRPEAEPKPEPKEEPKREPKREPKKDRKEPAKSKGLEKYLRGNSSLYKVVKEAAKDQKSSTKEVLKNLKVSKNEDGSIVISL